MGMKRGHVLIHCFTPEDPKSVQEADQARRLKLLKEDLFDTPNTIGIRWLVTQLLHKKEKYNLDNRTIYNAYAFEHRRANIMMPEHGSNPDKLARAVMQRAQYWLNDAKRLYGILEPEAEEKPNPGPIEEPIVEVIIDL